MHLASRELIQCRRFYLVPSLATLRLLENNLDIKTNVSPYVDMELRLNGQGKKNRAPCESGTPDSQENQHRFELLPLPKADRINRAVPGILCTSMSQERYQLDHTSSTRWRQDFLDGHDNSSPEESSGDGSPVFSQTGSARYKNHLPQHMRKVLISTPDG